MNAKSNFMNPQKLITQSSHKKPKQKNIILARQTRILDRSTPQELSKLWIGHTSSRLLNCLMELELKYQLQIKNSSHSRVIIKIYHISHLTILLRGKPDKTNNEIRREIEILINLIL